MLVQELYSLAQVLEQEGKLPPSYHKVQPIQWVIQLDLKGNLKQVILGASLKQATPFLKRTSKIEPLLLVDKWVYVLGVEPELLQCAEDTNRYQWVDSVPEKKKVRAEESLGQYLALIEELVNEAQNTSDPYVLHYQAVLLFLNDEGARWNVIQNIMERDTKNKPGDLFVFEVEGVQVHKTSCVKRFWARKREEANLERGKHQIQGECMLTGETGVLASVHPTELRFGPHGVSLISANGSAFESYGLSQSTIAPMMPEPARLYGEALRYLMTTKEHHFDTGQVRYVFWRKSLADPVLHKAFDDPMGLFHEDFFESQEGDIRQALLRVFKGGEGALESLDTDLFYGAALTANTSRLVVRDVVVQSVTQVIEHLAVWLEKQALVDPFEPSKQLTPQGIWSLARGACRLSEKSKKPVNPPSRLVTALLRTALHGVPLPLELLHTVLRRLPQNLSSWSILKTRLILVRMILNDHFQRIQGGLMTPSLDLDNTRPEYLCGRLLALLEDAQYAALGKVNTTVTDRFYGTASSSPAMVFPRLMRGVQNHLHKIKRDKPAAYGRLQKELEEIMVHLKDFPQTLSMVEQGVFALGYYHQKADVRHRIQEAKARQNKA